MEEKESAKALRIIYLLSLEKEGLSIAEQEELDLWAASNPKNKQLIIDFQDVHYRESILQKWSPEIAENSLQHVKERMNQIKRRVLWTRVVSAASLIFILGTGLFLYNSLDKSVTDYARHPVENDIAPGKNTATLTLSDGSNVVLSAASTGKLAEQAGVIISKTADGQIVYKVKSTGGRSEIKQNTLSTAKGETYRIELPDGTRVWLNAATKLKFPSTFEGASKRRVELYGEAYFEIAKDKSHPFIVHSEGQDVEVLGTHFNINSYTDESATTTTLFEGAVRISSIGDKGQENKNIPVVHLVPGQQSILNETSIKVQQGNLEEIMAWKNGYFKFDDESLKSVMRKLERWYDVEVVYDGTFENEGFSGKISRSRNISKVLKILESTKTVHFKIEGRRITVSN